MPKPCFRCLCRPKANGAFIADNNVSANEVVTSFDASRLSLHQVVASTFAESSDSISHIDAIRQPECGAALDITPNQEVLHPENCSTMSECTITIQTHDVANTSEPSMNARQSSRPITSNNIKQSSANDTTYRTDKQFANGTNKYLMKPLFKKGGNKLEVNVKDEPYVDLVGNATSAVPCKTHLNSSTSSTLCASLTNLAAQSSAVTASNTVTSRNRSSKLLETNCPKVQNSSKVITNVIQPSMTPAPKLQQCPLCCMRFDAK